MFVAEQADGHHHALREERVAVFQHQAEAAVQRLDANDRAGVEVGRDLLLDPQPVADEIFDRQQLRHVHADLPVIVVERHAVRRIGDVGSGPRRAQLHAGRHVLPPERQRVAEDAYRDIGRAQMRGNGETIGAGADDRDGGIISGLDGIDRNIHGHFLCVATPYEFAQISLAFLAV